MTNSIPVLLHKPTKPGKPLLTIYRKFSIMAWMIKNYLRPAYLLMKVTRN